MALGPIGLVYLDWRHALAGGLAFGLFSYAAILIWPALAWLFILCGHFHLAWEAGNWVSVNKRAFILPLSLDLALLFLLAVMLRMAWAINERGSMLACILTLFISTPVVMISAMALRNVMVNEFLGPLRLDAPVHEDFA